MARTLSELRDIAIAELEANGWTKFVFQNTDGSICLGEAVDRAEMRHTVTKTGVPFFLCRAVTEAVQRRGYDSDVGFNDHPDTSYADVLDLLEAIA